MLFIFVSGMKPVSITILLFLVMTQTFSKWFVVMAFNLNRDFIAKNLCENRSRPKLNCKGNCFLMKKIKQEEEKERKAPAPLKTEISSIVLSSRSFYPSAELPLVFSLLQHYSIADAGKPVDQPSAFFHPPSA